jgi:hypothetical protein
MHKWLFELSYLTGDLKPLVEQLKTYLSILKTGLL